eukprot:365445-Chlamydomonas_euryale.AAC.11
MSTPHLTLPTWHASSCRRRCRHCAGVRRYLTNAEKAEVRKSEKEGCVTTKVKVGKLYLVDLAGSERLKKSK